MTLCNSGPDVIPVASRKFSENCRSRRRPANSAEVRRPTNENIEERHMCDNRHYYHHGHAHRHHHLHRSISTNSNHRHTSNDVADIRNNNINRHFNFDVVDGLGRVSGHEYDAEHNFQPDDYQNILNGNFQHLHVHHQQNHHLNNNNCNRQNLNLPHISIDTVNDSDSLPALSPNAFSANDGNHDNNNNNSSNNNNNNGSQNLDVQGGNPNRALMVPIPVPRAIFDHPTPPTSPGYASQRRHSAHAILERPIPHLPDDVDPEVTKDIVHALRNIGDNLDVKMRHHNQPSVKDMLNAANLTVSQAVVMTLRRHNVLGVTFGASLHLLHQFMRL